MSLLAPSLAGANYMTSNNEDRESATNGAAEFTRRKKWPEILLKELVGGTIFCLKPVLVRRISQQGTAASTWGWKIIYASPASGDMVGQKPAELDGKDFFDLVFAPDHPQLQTFFNSLLTPSLPHLSSSTTVATTSTSTLTATAQQNAKLSPSQTTYVRMISGSGDSPSSSSDTATPGSSRRSGPVVWELRAHASGVGEENVGNAGLEGFGPAGGGMGTVNPTGGEEGGMKGKAIWVMGRKMGESPHDSEGSGGSSSGNGNVNGNGNGNGNGQSLDAFLELKLENERLREELRELQLDLDEEYIPPRTSYSEISPVKQQYASSSPSSSSPSSSASSPSNPNPNFQLDTQPSASAIPKPKKSGAGPGRPPKDPSAPTNKDKEKEREKKRAKRLSLAAGGEKEGMHVCVTCGRTDSPEWRKGPLGPKTLCNACGLRWAKRNSTQPGRKERKTDGKK